jgi:hypothetical protein
LNQSIDRFRHSLTAESNPQFADWQQRRQSTGTLFHAIVPNIFSRPQLPRPALLGQLWARNKCVPASLRKKDTFHPS